MEYRPLLRRRIRAGHRSILARLELDLLAAAPAGTEGSVEAFPEFLDYLAATGRYIFHGSNRQGITEFRTGRESPDTSAFGRRQAVFGTHDPHWAMFYAPVDRDNAFLIAHASMAIRRSSRIRWHRRTVFANNLKAPGLTAARLYVLPPRRLRAGDPKIRGAGHGPVGLGTPGPALVPPSGLIAGLSPRAFHRPLPPQRAAGSVAAVTEPASNTAPGRWVR